MDQVARVSARLVDGGLTLAVAESCTGGLLATRLTDLEGASRFFLAGITAYSNEAKAGILGVPDALIVSHGAVSDAVVGAMTRGVRQLTGATAGIGITGIAGPGGGTAEKPVGTVWIAASVRDRADARRFLFGGDRTEIRERSVYAALELLDSLMEAS